jgi:uncharacterized membrane protein (Fun14 family)
MRFMDEIKIGGLVGLFAGVSLAQVQAVVTISVGIATFVYIVSKTIKVWRGKKGGDDGSL